MLDQKSIHGSIESMSIMKEGSSVSSLDGPDKESTVVPQMTISWHDVVATAKKAGKAEIAPTKKNDSWKANNMECGPPEKKRVLDKAYGVARPGEVVAILGPSGAGKTSLLNVLTQRNCAELDVTGSVKVNGLRVTRSFMKKVCAYVQQDDLFIGSLTVEEHLNFMAKLRMGRKSTKEERDERVQQVMTDLGLKGSANSLIGTRTKKGLSGGEKKRLAFASEILTRPPILICDEPTSGLDAFLAYQVICVLKDLARNNGMTILLTIHQPSSQVFQLFDSVYIMVDGRVAFCGNQLEAERLWEDLDLSVPMNFNPCDHYLATLSVRENGKEEYRQRDQIRRICDGFQKSEQGKAIWREATGRILENEEYSESSSEGWRRRYDSYQESSFNSNFFQQVAALTWRAMKTVIREPTLLKVQITQSVVIALLTGLIYTNNNPITQQKIMNVNGSLYTMISNIAFMFQFSVVHHFCFEINTFYRESGSGLYRVSAYFIAKNLAEFPSYALAGLIFSTILYWMSGMVFVLDSFLIYTLVGLLVQNVAISIGYMFSCIFGMVNLATAVMPTLVVPLMAVGGFFINQASLPTFFVPLKYLSYFGYGYEAVAIGQWMHIEEIPGCNSTRSPSSCPKNGQEVLASMSFKPSNLWLDVGILVAMIVAFRFIAFVALLIRAKRRN